MTACPCALQRMPQHRPAASPCLRRGGSGRGRHGCVSAASRGDRRRGAPLPRCRRSPWCAAGFRLQDPIQLGERLLAIVGDAGSLLRIVASDEVGGQRVDPALQRLGELDCGERLRAPWRCGCVIRSRSSAESASASTPRARLRRFAIAASSPPSVFLASWPGPKRPSQALSSPRRPRPSLRCRWCRSSWRRLFAACRFLRRQVAAAIGPGLRRRWTPVAACRLIARHAR